MVSVTQVDAVMTVDVFDEDKLGLLGMEVIEPWFECTSGGGYLPDWFLYHVLNVGNL